MVATMIGVHYIQLLFSAFDILTLLVVAKASLLTIVLTPTITSPLVATIVKPQATKFHAPLIILP